MNNPLPPYIMKATYIPFFLITLIAAAILSGCMETTMVPEQLPRTIEVSAAIVNEGTGQRAPLNGVNIRLFELRPNTTLDGPLLAEARTDATGVARLNVLAPVVGENYAITGEFNGQVQRLAPVLVCNDTNLAFRFAPRVFELTCGAQNDSDSLVILDDDGSDLLIQNTPTGVGIESECWSMRNDASNGTATVTLGEVAVPFRVDAAFVNGTRVPIGPDAITIPPGGTLTICLSVPTNQTGNFTTTLLINTNCNGQPGQVRLNARATVVPPQCRCSESTLETVLVESTERVPVDSTREISTTLFTNDLACSVTLQGGTITGADAGDWQIIEPTFPRVVAQGASVAIRVRFRPRSAGPSRASVDLTVAPLGAEPCDLPVELRGNGCSNACPLIEVADVFRSFSSTQLIDTLSDRTDNRVPVNAGALSSVGSSTVTRSYRIENPDSACGPLALTIDATGTDTTSARFFDVSPRSLTIAPGSAGFFEVTFTAPDATDFAAIVQRRQQLHPPPPQTADSAFVLELRLLGNGCAQPLRIPAVLTPCPGITKIINLRAYNQQTPQKPVQENETYSFGDLDSRVRKGAGGSPGPYPPVSGDIFIDVTDNAQTATPPQQPILRLVPNSSIRMGIWKRNYPEAQFECGTATEFCPEENLPNYSQNDITGIQPGDVIAFDLGGTYALLYVRAVFNGTENNTNRQTALEFRVLFPIRCP